MENNEVYKQLIRYSLREIEMRVQEISEEGKLSEIYSDLKRVLYKLGFKGRWALESKLNKS
jgi:virulence-associated protein VapD